MTTILSGGIGIGLPAQIGYSIGAPGLVAQSGFIPQPGPITQPGLIGGTGVIGGTQIVGTTETVTTTVTTPIPAISSVAVAPGIPNSAVIGQTGIIGQPACVGTSMVGGVSYGGVGTTNQFNPGLGYGQGFFGYCPWWLWVIVAFLILGGFIASILSSFSSGKNFDDRQESDGPTFSISIRSNDNKNVESKTSTSNLRDKIDGVDQNSEGEKNKRTTRTTTQSSSQNAIKNGTVKHHLRYSVWA